MLVVGNKRCDKLPVVGLRSHRLEPFKAVFEDPLATRVAEIGQLSACRDLLTLTPRNILTAEMAIPEIISLKGLSTTSTRCEDGEKTGTKCQTNPNPRMKRRRASC